MIASAAAAAAAAAAAFLLLLNVHLVHLGRCCDEEGTVMICRSIPSRFSPGHLTLLMYVSGVGEINSTAFRSGSLASVTRLRMDGAGVTGIAAGAFGSFQNLASVSLDGNEVTRVSARWFGRPAVLRELSLAGNRVEAVDGSALAGLVGLARLSLRQNRIRTLEPDAFLSQANLAQLDLSGNRMTRVSPRVFGSLGSTRIQLDGNPWDCPCGAEDFVVFLKDLRSRSLLDGDLEVTCESPASLRGRPVWNVSVCATSPTTGPGPGPGPASLTVHQETSGATVPTTSGTSAVVTTPSQPEPNADASAQTKRPTDDPLTVSSRSASPPAPPTPEAGPVRSTDARSTDAPTTLPTHTAAHVTATPSEAQTSTPPLAGPGLTGAPGSSGSAETCVASGQLSDTSTVCTLVVVIVVLCALLLVACFLAARRRRKRSSKAVAPGRQGEERNRSDGGDRDPSDTDPDAARGKPLTGARARSAGAVLFTSPLCASGKDQVAVQSETGARSEDTGNRADGGRGPENETGRTRAENTDTADGKEKRAGADGKLDEKPRRVSVSADAAPYLSIGTNQNDPTPDGLHQQGQRSQVGKVMGRVSTWPPTAAEWQGRRRVKQEEDAETSPGEERKSVNEVERRSVSGRDEDEDEDETHTADSSTAPNPDPQETNAARPDLTLTPPPKLNVSEAQALDEEAEEDEPPRQRAESRRAGSTAAASGVSTAAASGVSTAAASGVSTAASSPDDETLLRGNEYAFMDLLHEVVQNNGRWTRERWKRMQVTKQQQQQRR